MKNNSICATIIFIFTLTTNVNLKANHVFNFSHINTIAQKVLGYDPSIELLHSTKNITEVTVTCHGYGANKEIGNYVASRLNMPIVTFNFPDHDINANFDVQKTSFGTLQEYLPIIYVLKTCIAHGIDTINLYGYSAGGGAIINMLAILNNPTYQKQLESIGVSQEDAETIKRAVSLGLIMLDTPLKSVTEILGIRPDETDIQYLARRYKANGFEPIDVIDQLAGMKLHILVYFEEPDEILSNRDDQLYYQKLKSVNVGTTHLVIGIEDGHFGEHEKLWQQVQEIRAQ